MKTWILTFLLSILAVKAVAAPYVVRSGDHDDFVRLVVQADADTVWKIERISTQLVVSAEGRNDGFDVSRAFERIDRSVVSDLKPSSGRLAVNLTCQCEYTYFFIQPNMLVVDIFRADAGVRNGSLLGGLERSQDQRGDIDSDPNWTDSLGATATVLSRLHSAELPSQDALLESDDPTTLPLESADNAPLETLKLPLFPLETPGLSSRQLGLELFYPDIQEAETVDTMDMSHRLSAQIGRAATQGLLTPSPHIPAGTGVEVDVNGVKREVTNDVGAERLAVELSDNYSFDNPISPFDFLSPNANSSGFSCDSNDLFAVQEWREDGLTGSVEQVSSLRRQLYSEFDRLNNEVLDELIRHYLFFGFGQEALQLLALVDGYSAQARAYQLIGRIMNDELVQGDIEYLSGCPTSMALWALLSSDGNVNSVNSDAVLMALNSMPPHMRNFLAPKVSEQFRDASLIDEAAQALRTLRNDSELGSAARKLEETEVALAKGNADRTPDMFMEVVEGNSLESPLALLRFLETKGEQKESVSDEIVSISEAMLTELRGAELEEPLRIQYAFSLVYRHDFSKLSETLAFEEFSKDNARKVASAALSVLESDAVDADFLVFLEKFLFFAQRVSNPEMAYSLVDRALGLGYPSGAAAVLDRTDKTGDPDRRAVLRAKIAIGRQDYEAALVALENVRGSESDKLRADVYFALEDFDRARAFYEQAKHVPEASQAVWSADSDEIVELDGGDPLLTELRNLSLREAPAEGGASIEQLDALTDDSRDLAGEIADLLAQPELSISSGMDG